ncbi:MAG: glycosyltransferase family 4 protein [Promethearchaeota archaeon]|jgi:glycosyltransferase involved in cell wall biosynthesis
MRILYLARDSTAWRKTLVEGLQKAGHIIIPLYLSESLNRYTFAIKTFIRAICTPFDVSIADFVTFGFLGAKICNIMKKPLVVYARGGDVDTKDPDFIKYVNLNWVKFALTNATIVICDSNYVIKRALELNPKIKNKVRLIYNGINTARFYPKKHNLSYRLLSVGDLRKRKGVEVILKAIPLIVKKYPQTHLTIIGRDWPRENYKHELLKLTHKLHIEHYVNFIGYVSDIELINNYRDADIFVHTPHYEPFGIVQIEAMASGLPIVATSTGGIPEVVPIDSLVQVNKPSDVAEKIISLFSLSDQERWKIGERNRIKVQTMFTSTLQVNNVIQVLKEAIQKYKEFTK